MRHYLSKSDEVVLRISIFRRGVGGWVGGTEFFFCGIDMFSVFEQRTFVDKLIRRTCWSRDRFKWLPCAPRYCRCGRLLAVRHTSQRRSQVAAARARRTANSASGRRQRDPVVGWRHFRFRAPSETARKQPAKRCEREDNANATVKQCYNHRTACVK